MNGPFHAKSKPHGVDVVDADGATVITVWSRELANDVVRGLNKAIEPVPNRPLRACPSAEDCVDPRSAPGPFTHDTQ